MLKKYGKATLAVAILREFNESGLGMDWQVHELPELRKIRVPGQADQPAVQIPH